MAKIVVRLDQEIAPDELESAVDAELDDFQATMLRHHPNMQPLAKFERAMLKTYLMARLIEAAAKKD